MATNSKIEWTDHTFNAWIGCAHVSPGCIHCYAETLSKRYNWAKWGACQPRKRTSVANWKKPIAWNRQAEKNGTRPKVFCASLSDWLDDEVPIAWLLDLLYLIDSCDHLDWLLLTKRPENWRSRISNALVLAKDQGRGFLMLHLSDWLDGKYPKNVWVGTTVENQKYADKRLPELKAIPANIHFLSCEPLLGHIRLSPFQSIFYDWVICGGESGAKCRPMQVEWAESLQYQCQSLGIPFFMKQLGGHPDKRGDIELFPAQLGVREFPNAVNI